MHVFLGYVESDILGVPQKIRSPVTSANAMSADVTVVGAGVKGDEA